MGNCLDIFFFFFFFFTAEETLHLCITLMSAFKVLCVTIRMIKKMQIPAFISSLRAACDVLRNLPWVSDEWSQVRFTPGYSLVNVND